MVEPVDKLLNGLHCLLPDGGLVEGGEDFEGREEDVAFIVILAIGFEFEEALGDLDEELVLVVHLLDDLDEVGDEFVADAVVA